jgi:polyferredoxin
MTAPAARRPRPNLRRSRRWLQVLGVAATLLVAVRHLLPGDSTAGAFDSFCPFGGVETLLPYLASGHTLKTTNLLNFTVLLGVLGVSLVAGRAFCGWMCPLGTLQDMLFAWGRRLRGVQRGAKLAHRAPLTLPASLDRLLRSAKYLILAAILVASLFTVYPPLHSLCPVRAIFAFALTPLLGAVLLGFVVTSLLVERASCKYFCPLGALLSVFNRFALLRLVSQDNCNACGRCSTACSMGIADVPDNLHDPECIRCLECLDTCARPDALVLKVLP